MLLFKLPFRTEIFTLDKNSTEHSVEFISFNEKQKIDFKGRMNFVSENYFEKETFTTKSLEYQTEIKSEVSKKDYLDNISSVIDFIKKENLKKLVISRIKVLDISEDENISLSDSFLKLCDAYPNAFVYLFKDKECWMGAFSELLGKFNKTTNDFETISLAGTLPVKERWTEKEIEEQKPVSDYIYNILNQYSGEIYISETYDHISGNIKHLRTDFKTKISRLDLDKIISELHPTPAVCGIPKKECKEAIRSFETYDRELYSGYIKVETDEDIFYFVNLRCGKFSRNQVQLYTGGGITAKSNPQKEWQETELKSEAIRGNLVWNTDRL